MMIRGLRTVGKGIKEEVKRIIKKYLGLEIYKRMKPIGGRLMVEFCSFKNQIEIMKRRRMLKGIDIWLKNDWMEVSLKIQKWR